MRRTRSHYRTETLAETSSSTTKSPISQCSASATRLTVSQGKSAHANQTTTERIFSISASNTQLHSLTETPTLKDAEKSTKSATFVINRAPNKNSYAPQAKPRQSMLSRTESMNTLSPCESICSEDLMMDFDCNSSIESAEQSSKSNLGDSRTRLQAINVDIDETQLWNEFEQKGNGSFKDWSYLLKLSRNKKQDISM